MASGQEALRCAAAEPFDLLVGDISMPEMDGCELLLALRATPRGATLPAVALTGLGGSENVDKVTAAGYAAHLTKPIDISKFIRVTRAVLERQASAGHAAPWSG